MPTFGRKMLHGIVDPTDFRLCLYRCKLSDLCRRESRAISFISSPLWLAAQAGQVSIVTSELTWLETLVKPLRDGNTVLEQLFRAFLTAEEVELIPMTLAFWEQAAHLRILGLKTPDALHAATGLGVGCALFLTNDVIFQRVPDLPVTILSAAIGS